MKEKFKTPYLLCLIGLIVGAAFLLISVIEFFIFKSLISSVLGKFFTFFLIQIFSMLLPLIFISTIISFILVIILLIFVIKLKKEPTRRNFIVITVISAIGIFTGLSFGAIISLIGGILGIVRSDKTE
tara:strand:+ start:406 stop:789 length:384 start_codon:yes stop_codon:yes gene_type:complete